MMKSSMMKSSLTSVDMSFSIILFLTIASPAAQHLHLARAHLQRVERLLRALLQRADHWRKRGAQFARDRVEALVNAANVGNVMRVRVVGLLGNGGLLRVNAR
jgi:hypothetical protein